MKEEDKRSLALVMAGAFFGLIPTALAPTIPLWGTIIGLTLLTISIIVCLLYGIGMIQSYFHRLRLRNRWKEPLRLGILSDSGWNQQDIQTYSWTDIDPDAWKASIETYAKTQSVRVKIETIEITSQLDDYAIVINPYGGVYPEENLAELTSLQKIINFVREGGVFVNVADIPSYWAYNGDLKKRIEIAETVYGTAQQATGIKIVSTKPFELTPLAKKLGLRIIGCDPPVTVNLSSPPGVWTGSILVSRATVVESNVISLVSTFRAIYPYDGQPYDMTPIFLVNFGAGGFLISLPWINDARHTQSQKDDLKDAISSMIVREFASRRQK